MLGCGARGEIPLTLRGHTKFAIIAFASLGLGSLLHRTPLDIDQNIPFATTVGSFFIFSFWYLSLWAWGSVLENRLGLPTSAPYIRIALGAAGSSLTAMALSHLGLIGLNFRSLAIVLPAIGLLFYSFLPEHKHRFRDSLSKIKITEGIVIFVLIVIAVTYALIAAQPAVGGSDEFRYHLVGPKLWFDAGRFYFPPNIPLVLQCTNWEYNYIWGFMLLAGRGSSGLIDAQIFAQWTHLFVGFGGTALALYALLSRYFLSRVWLLAALIACLSYSHMGSISYTAKNDWGAALWTLCGLSLLFTRTQTKRKAAHLLMIGVFFGFGFTTKFTVAFPIFVALVTATLMNFRRSPETLKQTALIVCGAVFASAPILFRNWIEIHNPFYPALSTLFKSAWVGPTWIWYQNQYEVKNILLNLVRWPEYLWVLLNRFPLFVLVPIFPFIATRGRSRRFMPLWITAAFGLILYMLKAKPGFSSYEHFMRLSNVSITLMLACSILSLEIIFSKLQKQTMLLLLGVTLSVLTVTSKVDWPIWKYVVSPMPHDEAIRTTLMGGDAQAWLRKTVSPNELILTTGFNQIYYISHLKFAIIPEQPEIDRKTVLETESKSLVRTLRHYDARYLLDVKHWTNVDWNPIAIFLKEIYMEHPSTIRFTGKNSMVIDLVALEQEVESACIKPHVNDMNGLPGPTDLSKQVELYRVKQPDF